MSLKNSASLTLTALVGALTLAHAGSSLAAENRAQRYSAGLGGSDMTNMLAPGWYGQVAMIHYHATKLKGDDGNSAVKSGSANGVPYTAPISHFRADAYALLPRATYISTNKLLGAHAGFTLMLPLVQRQTSITGDASVSAATISALTTRFGGGQAGAAQAQGAAAAVVRGVNSNIAALSGTAAGIGDLEIAPLLNWEIGENQTVTLTPTMVFPTGDYDASKPVNASFGHFYTFRPSVQYGYIADGWDVGARAVFSVNTRNEANGYKSGNMFNLDFAAMKFVTEDLRLGVQGYVVQQLTDDNSTDATAQASIKAANGNQMRAYALGPALAWIKNGGEMLMEGKILQEFGARNRAEGTTFMLTISKPFGL